MVVFSPGDTDGWQEMLLRMKKVPSGGPKLSRITRDGKILLRRCDVCSTKEEVYQQWITLNVHLCRWCAIAWLKASERNPGEFVTEKAMERLVRVRSSLSVLSEIQKEVIGA